MGPDDRQLNQEDPIRKLFQDVGRHQAPDDLEGLVMARLAGLPNPAQPAAPLIGKPVWGAIAACMAAVAAVAWTWPSPDPGPSSPTVTALLSFLNEGVALLASPWWLAGIAALGILMAMDRWTHRALGTVGV